MGIKRGDIDNRKVDFSNIASGRRLPPVHPGEILRDEFLTMKISVLQTCQCHQSTPHTRQ
jgi:antitoxin HigA-1